jgi:glutamate racemase
MQQAKILQNKGRRYKIGVFDSGAGGEVIANVIAQARPKDSVIYRSDKQNLPYGNKTVKQIHAACRPVLEALQQEGCEVIVIACNTVTTNLIGLLREELDVPLIGMEPMVKPAAKASQSKIIAVCATPRTLSSQRYKTLKETYAKGVKVIEPDCSDWAMMIENDTVDFANITRAIEDVVARGADQIVLGCTHYHWIEELIVSIAGSRARVIQPEKPVLDQLSRVLEQLP